MAPENVHLYCINKTLININTPRYECFRNVSLKLSSVNKFSYEWYSKALFNAFLTPQISDSRAQSKKESKIALTKTELHIHAVSNSK